MLWQNQLKQIRSFTMPRCQQQTLFQTFENRKKFHRDHPLQQSRKISPPYLVTSYDNENIGVTIESSSYGIMCLYWLSLNGEFTVHITLTRGFANLRQKKVYKQEQKEKTETKGREEDYLNLAVTCKYVKTGNGSRVGN